MGAKRKKKEIHQVSMTEKKAHTKKKSRSRGIRNSKKNAIQDQLTR